jgi:hypothetical protein
MSYRYSPKVFDRPADLVAQTLYVVGGLYGNVEALEAIRALAASEPRPVTLVFNGDFHWFDASPADFESIDSSVAGHHALRGNVETEIASEDSGVGCGCAYPLDVGDAEVSRSNEILERLRDTARGFPRRRERLAALPMHLVAEVAGARIGIVHGDAASLAGWGFAADRLDDPSHRRWIESAFADARVDAFASTHTCLPAFRGFERGLVANNGAAGMPNFAGRRSGLVTRIGAEPHGGAQSLYRATAGNAHVEALEIAYDHDRWLQRFLASWPQGSAAHASYFRRIVEGPRFEASQARPRAA